MSKLILFNKPYGVLSQFTDKVGRPVLADYIDLKKIYPAGRLDLDSEGLLLLTDDGALAHQLTHPRKQTWKTYWVQVEGRPGKQDLRRLRDGLEPLRLIRVAVGQWQLLHLQPGQWKQLSGC